MPASQSSLPSTLKTVCPTDRRRFVAWSSAARGSLAFDEPLICLKQRQTRPAASLDRAIAEAVIDQTAPAWHIEHSAGNKTV